MENKFHLALKQLQARAALYVSKQNKVKEVV